MPDNTQNNMQGNTNDNISSANQTLKISNPFKALSAVFYQPRAVFDALAVKENWSWIPFLLFSFVLLFPSYLFFNVVDFNWWQQMVADLTLGDVAPDQKEAFMQATTLKTAQVSQMVLSALVYPILGFAVLAGYYSFVTREDEKSVQGYSDWYGAMWWMALPLIINALLAILLLSFQSPNSQISDNIMSPLSLAMLFNIDALSKWYSVAWMLRLDFLATIYLGYVGLRSWTAFSKAKATIAALAPYSIILVVSLIWAVMS